MLKKLSKIDTFFFKLTVENTTLSYVYDNSLKSLFKCDNDPEPFTPRLRILLADNILNNLNISIEQIQNQDHSSHKPSGYHLKYGALKQGF